MAIANRGLSKPTLFMTYDGLLDPLGASQVVPYLKDISAHPRKLYVLSFEKNERLCSEFGHLRDHLAKFEMKWTALKFTRRFGVVGKAWDLLRMYLMSLVIVVSCRPAIVHARGHSAAQVGFLLKRLFGLKLTFDFRGLWVDERVDKGSWDLAHGPHRWQYLYFKRVERKLLRYADQLVVLTEKVVPEVRQLGCSWSTEMTVIPCCADFEHFPLVTPSSRAQAREGLGIPKESRVLGYLGSTERMYRVDRLFRLFEMAVGDCNESYLLVVTPDVSSLRGLMAEHLPTVLHKRVHVVSASRSQVPHFIAAMDMLIREPYMDVSRKASF